MKKVNTSDKTKQEKSQQNGHEAAHNNEKAN